MKLLRSSSYFFKILEIRYRTWQRGREIGRAYASTPRIVIPARLFLWVAAVAGTVAVAAVVRVGPGSRIGRPENGIAEREAAEVEQILKDTVLLINEPTTNVVDTHVTEVAMPADELHPVAQWHPSEQIRFLVLANKADRQLYLLRYDSENWSVHRQYPMAIGENLGPKRHQGDKRTPEGTYFVVGRKDQSELQPKYGPLAFILNYPNDDDRKAGRTGQGIWIHGTSPDSLPLQTQGCLELDNRSMLELGQILGHGIGVPVVITNEENLTDPISYPAYAEIAQGRHEVVALHRARQDELTRILHLWEQAWEDRNIERYSEFYDTGSFLSVGIAWPQWREKKLGTFRAYTGIEVGIDKVLLAGFGDASAVVTFLQQYQSDKVQASNAKRLRFRRRNGRWLIQREETFPIEEHLL